MPGWPDVGEPQRDNDPINPEGQFSSEDRLIFWMVAAFMVLMAVVTLTGAKQLEDRMDKQEAKMKFEPVGEIKLGDVAKDTISGFEGQVFAITDWLYQCRRIGLQPMKLNKDGKPFDTEWFDELQRKLVKGEEAEALGEDKGGPRPAPTRNSDPS